MYHRKNSHHFTFLSVYRFTFQCYKAPTCIPLYTNSFGYKAEEGYAYMDEEDIKVKQHERPKFLL